MVTNSHVFVMSEGGEVTDLTPGEGHKAGFAGWASDGESFYIFSNEREGGAFDMYRYSAADYSRSMLYENSEGLDLGAISDDGRWVVYARNNSNADNDLFLIDVTAETPELVTITPHEGNVEYSAMGFTPTIRRSFTPPMSMASSARRGHCRWRRVSAHR